MNEYEIAMKKVLPYICSNLGWPKQLVSEYGRVPVQIGSTTSWADFVCYIYNNQKPVPWLLVEVKQPEIEVELAVPQAESYSLILSAPFFCVTNGKDYDFYKTGGSQGQRIKLKEKAPLPTNEFMEIGIQSFPPIIDYVVDKFLEGLKTEPEFLKDTQKHYEEQKLIHEKIFKRIDSLSPEVTIEVLRGMYMHTKRMNEAKIFAQIKEDFGRFKSFLSFINKFTGDPVQNLKQLLDKEGKYYIKGSGLFFITQMLAGAHPDDYIVLQEDMSKALKKLGMTEIVVRNDQANGYVYANEICKRLFTDKLKQKLRDHGYNFGLASVHNLLWHWYNYYDSTGKWCS